MVASFGDRIRLERFLRDASAAELSVEREHLQSLLSNTPQAVSEDIIRELVARITYELRFRVPQNV